MASGNLVHRGYIDSEEYRGPANRKWMYTSLPSSTSKTTEWVKSTSLTKFVGSTASDPKQKVVLATCSLVLDAVPETQEHPTTAVQALNCPGAAG